MAALAAIPSHDTSALRRFKCAPSPATEASNAKPAG